MPRPLTLRTPFGTRHRQLLFHARKRFFEADLETGFEILALARTVPTTATKELFENIPHVAEWACTTTERITAAASSLSGSPFFGFDELLVAKLIV